LEAPRLERAIGVIYRPDSELQSHYFQALLPHQFDEYIWFDVTEAVTPLAAPHLAGVPETYPFGV
jgi:protein-L-isoaspartate(D-aspartate) O-methyltransferase